VVVERAASSVLILGHDRSREATALAEILSDEGVDAAIARRIEDAQRMIATWHRDLVVVDGDVVDVGGLAALLAGLREQNPELPVVLMTSWPACDPRIVPALVIIEGWYVMKPIDIDELVAMIRTVAALRRTGEQNPLQRAAVPAA